MGVDTVYKIGINIDPHCFTCEKPDCSMPCPYAREPLEKPALRTRKIKRPDGIRRRDAYRYLREEGICVRCAKAPADAGSRCAACKARDEENKRRREEREGGEPKSRPYEYERYQKKRYDARKAAGLCVRCGKAPADAGTCCAACKARDDAARAKRMERFNPLTD